MEYKRITLLASCIFFALLPIFVKNGYSQYTNMITSLVMTNPVYAQVQGRCGDGICDDFEKAHPDLCPQDCGPQKLRNKTSTETAPTPITANVTVDYSSAVRNFNPHIFGAIAAPYFEQSGFNLTKDIGSKLVLVFTDTEKPLPSNPDDPSQYDFKLLDKQIEAIINIGAEPIVTFAPLNKPADLDKYALYVQNIAKHLTQGWGNGHKWDVKVFRFGNEPDNAEFWKGSRQEFFKTYAAWAKVLKAVNPKFILVAPALMAVRYNNPVSETLNPWINSFLEYCRINRVPLDYFSFHAYTPVIYYGFYDNPRLVQGELNKYPTLSPLFGAPRLANDEWNITLGDLWSGAYSRQFDSAWPAAHYINALINMIEHGLHLSVPMFGTFNGGQGGCHDFLLVDCKDKGKPAYYAIKGFNQLAETIRLSTTGTDHMNFAAISGKKTNEIILVLANYNITGYLDKYEQSNAHAWTEYNTYVSKFGIPNIYDKFHIIVKNLPWVSSQRITYDRYLVDDKHNLELVESKTVSGDKTLSFRGEMTAPSVNVIKVYLK